MFLLPISASSLHHSQSSTGSPIPWCSECHKLTPPSLCPQTACAQMLGAFRSRQHNYKSPSPYVTGKKREEHGQNEHCRACLPGVFIITPSPSPFHYLYIGNSLHYCSDRPIKHQLRRFGWHRFISVILSLPKHKINLIIQKLALFLSKDLHDSLGDMLSIIETVNILSNSPEDICD